ncbi:MAG: hypothetical protein AB8F95_22320 [Bacteroidia bacterium]
MKPFFSLVLSLCLWMFIGTCCVSAQTNLYSPAPKAFSDTSHLVSTTFFHWYASTGGQLTGPWRPIEGRPNWTGLPPWWKSQIKQVMAANIDILYVHLIPSTEIRRILLFQALSEMRAEGYDVPKVAPFLDPLITWDGRPKPDLATTAGKDSVAAQYVRFYTQYFAQNTDTHASDYLAYVDNKPVLDTWHVFELSNVGSLSEQDLSSRLGAAFGVKDSRFNNGVHMVTTGINNPVYSFADERVAQFEITQYYHATTHQGIKSVQLKPGYWDQNVRTPGDFLPRDGGIHYAAAWDQVDATVNRIYVESWNEYDEGTGIYAGDTLAPYIHPGSNNMSTDTWSLVNNPYEYIETTAQGSAKFNDYPRLDARFLWHEAPIQLAPNQVDTAHIIIRNEGDEMWSNAKGYTLKQSPSDPVQFASQSGMIDDLLHDIPTFGGVFKGRPLRFDIPIIAPMQKGSYDHALAYDEGRYGSWGGINDHD